MKKEEKNVHERMCSIKKELSKSKIPKSGHNKFAGFKYHELQDFMPFINELNEKHGVNCYPRFLKHEGICVLKVINTSDKNDYYEIVVPFVEAEMLAKGGAPSNVDAIQRMGSTLTYNRRYLYMTAYDIVESDGVDAMPPKEPKKPKKPVLKDLHGTIKQLINDEVKLSEIKTKYQIGEKSLDLLETFEKVKGMKLPLPEKREDSLIMPVLEDICNILIHGMKADEAKEIFKLDEKQVEFINKVNK